MDTRDNRLIRSLSALLLLLGAAGAKADVPTFHHHHHDDGDGEERDHYKDDGQKPVSVAPFRSRALLGKSGATDLEITTGVFDTSATPPGTLKEVHVRALRPNGKQQFEREYEHLSGGYARFTYTDLIHGQTLWVKVEAKGLPGREDGEAEAKLVDTVLYRPDLAVSNLDFPLTARVNTAVEVNATVSEQMRDTGAHADCVLLVDGQAVDKAPGIWVDAAGSVTCHFVHTFKVAGKHGLEVQAQNVLPEDYDLSNNARAGTIEIQDSAGFSSYSASIFEMRSDSQSVRDLFVSTTSTVPDQHDVSVSSSTVQSRSFSGAIQTPVKLPLAKVSYVDQSDGTTLSSLSFTGVGADFTVDTLISALPTLSMAFRSDPASGAWFTLRRYSNAATGAGVTLITLNWFAGEVTYHSEGYCRSVTGLFTCFGGDYTRNETTRFATFAPVRLGKTYSADVILDDGTPYQTHPSMALRPIASTYATPMTCSPANFNGSAGKTCWSSTATFTITTGATAVTQ